MSIRNLLIALSTSFLLAACGSSKPAADKGTDTSGADASGAVDISGDKRAEVMQLFMEATQARLAGKPQKAIQLYQQCLKLDPQNSAAMFELGKLYHQAQNGPQALEYARMAVSADKKNIWYRFLLADLYQEAGRADDAVATYRGIIASWPDRYEVYIDLANTLAYSGKVNEAIKVYADMEKRFGLSEELIMQQFSMLAGNNRMEEAEELVQRAIEAHPNEPGYQGLLAEVYDQRGESEKALAQYLKAVEMDPGNSMLRVALAEHYYGAGKVEPAFEQLEVAFEDPEMDLDTKMQVVIGFFEMSNHEGLAPNDRPDLIRRSYSLIEAMERTHPESGKPHTIHGDFLLRDGDYEAAREQFRIALRSEQDRFPIWSQLLQLDLQLNDDSALVSDSDEAITLFPTVPQLYLYKGIALTRMNRHEEAIETFIQGRDLVVDDRALTAQFWTSLGDVYNEAGQFPRSDQAFDKALDLDPDNPTTLNNYAYYLSVRGQYLEKAERMSKRSNELAPGQPSFLDTYAWVLFRMGRYPDALIWIEKAIEAGGHDQGVIVEHLGDILFKIGEPVLALEQWQKAKILGDASDALDRKISGGTWVE